MQSVQYSFCHTVNMIQYWYCLEQIAFMSFTFMLFSLKQPYEVNQLLTDLRCTTYLLYRALRKCNSLFFTNWCKCTIILTNIPSDSNRKLSRCPLIHCVGSCHAPYSYTCAQWSTAAYLKYESHRNNCSNMITTQKRCLRHQNVITCQFIKLTFILEVTTSCQSVKPPMLHFLSTVS